VLIERTHIRPDDLEEQDNRVPLSDYVTLMEAGVELCDEPALALLFGEAVRLQAISIVGLIGEASETTEEARQQLNRYAHLMLDEDEARVSEHLELVRDEGRVWLKLTSPLYVDNRLLIESGFARSICGAREIFGSTNDFARWPYPKAIHFTHEEPSYRAEYDRVFGVPLVFGSHMNALLMDEAFLSIRLPRANRYVFGVLSAHAEWVHQDPVTKSQRFTSSTGALLANRVDLDPWGLETDRSVSPEKQPRRFTTYERDSNKSDEAMSRRYTAKRNRFDQPDPWDGSYNLANPQTFNRYAYAHNDPVNFVDPSGLQDSWNCSAQYSFEQCGGNSGFWGGGGFGDSVAYDNDRFAGITEHMMSSYLDHRERFGNAHNGSGFFTNQELEAIRNLDFQIHYEVNPDGTIKSTKFDISVDMAGGRGPINPFEIDSPMAGGLNPNFHPIPWRNPSARPLKPGPVLRPMQPPPGPPQGMKEVRGPGGKAWVPDNKYVPRNLSGWGKAARFGWGIIEAISRGTGSFGTAVDVIPVFIPNIPIRHIVCSGGMCTEEGPQL
jgi:RHS repeat-associated protein